MKFLHTAILGGLFCISGSPLALSSNGSAGDDVDPTSIDDKGLLANRKMPTDGPGLVAFFEKCSGSAVDLPKAPELVRKLGSTNEAERKQAFKRLVALGPGAFPCLAEARTDTNRAIAEQAKTCSEEIEKQWPMLWVLAPAVRTLAQQGAPGAAKALLRFLPYAGQGELEEEVWNALDALVRKDGKIDQSFVDALADPVPARRAAPSYLLGRWGNAEQQAQALNKGLSDTDAEVKLRAAQGLLGSKHKEVVSTLINLLPASSVPVAWQAEELLLWLATDKAPKAYVGTGTKTSRDQCHKAWLDWWRYHQANFDLERAFKRDRRPGLYLIAEHTEGQRHHRLWTCGFDGKLRWLWESKFDVELTRLRDWQILPNGRLLLAKDSTSLSHHNRRQIERANRQGYGLTECDLDGNVLWSFSDVGFVGPYACCRLLNGNTLAAPGGGRVFEVDAGANKVRTHEFPITGQVSDDRHTAVYPFRLDTDRWLYALTEHVGSGYADQGLRIFDDRGKPLKEIFPPVELRPLKGGTTMQYLPNGRLCFVNSEQTSVIEIDSRGKLVWTNKGGLGKRGLVKALRNGHLLFSFNMQKTQGTRLLEVDRSGKILWEAQSDWRYARHRPSFDILRLGF